jgi:hypothetical protein
MTKKDTGATQARLHSIIKESRNSNPIFGL